MDFQTVIFNRFRELFISEAGPNPAAFSTGPKPASSPAAPKPAAVSSSPAATSSSPAAKPGMSDGKKALRNVGIGAGVLAAGATGVAGYNKVQNATPAAAETAKASAAETAKATAAKAAEHAPSTSTLAQKGANMADALHKSAGATKDAAKGVLGHAADVVTAHPGPALAAGAAGTAAWLARRRALKNVSRGI